nr:MAG TPA: hypothetical protein [Caudoviricetes sp.]
MNIKKIEFILENCEVITIDGRFIGDFDLDNIKTRVRRVANAINKIVSVEDVAIEIRSLANVTTTCPWGVDETFKPFDRLTEHHDITAIVVYFNDNSSECYYVNYRSKGDYIGAKNLNQHTHVSSLGNLYLVISEKNTIEDYWDIRKINDENAMYFKFSMYNITK